MEITLYFEIIGDSCFWGSVHSKVCGSVYALEVKWCWCALIRRFMTFAQKKMWSFNISGGNILPEFLSLRFLNTETITSKFPSTSTTVVKISTLARIPMTQAGRVLPSVASVRSSCPSRGSVRFFMRVNVSGITGHTAPTVLLSPGFALSPAGTAGTGVSWMKHGAHLKFHESALEVFFL